MTLQINGLALYAGDFKIESLDLKVEKGEYFVMMGPTGSGKSLLLKSICGVHRVGRGSINISGKDVTFLQPKDRELGYVPQNSSLFPNMNVKRNIQFPFDVKAIPKNISEEKVRNIAKMLNIESLLARKTIHLSGGESQKVALARALATEPEILILDEPVSAVDEPTRREICTELVRVQKELQITTIHVCHSLEEAKSVSNRVGIMADGKICALGKLEDILRSEPENLDVRRLLGL